MLGKNSWSNTVLVPPTKEPRIVGLQSGSPLGWGARDKSVSLEANLHNTERGQV